jgi:hypothetical protein
MSFSIYFIRNSLESLSATLMPKQDRSSLVLVSDDGVHSIVHKVPSDAAVHVKVGDRLNATDLLDLVMKAEKVITL